jgi:hypothetical protein
MEPSSEERRGERRVRRGGRCEACADEVMELHDHSGRRLCLWCLVWVVPDGHVVRVTLPDGVAPDEV